MSVGTAGKRGDATGSMSGEADIFGRIRDVDTHEMVPARRWVEEYGEFVAPVAEFFMGQSPNIPNSFSVQRDDDLSITPEGLGSFWSKACLAPGAYDMQRRLAVMDIAGIADSLLFGSALAIAGLEFAAGGGGLAEMQAGPGRTLPFEPRPIGLAMIKAHNDWCLRTVRLSTRLRPVATVLTENLAEAIRECRRMIDGGVRAINIPAGLSIDGKAPCHPDNDVLWRLLAKSNVPVLLHVGGEKPFLREPKAWINCPQFVANNTVPTELNVDPFSMATCGLAAQNFLCNVVLGGVFERVPELRCGFMELGAHWVGPTGQNMDLWVGEFANRFSKQLSMKPSEYLRRNVRVSPFTFEPVHEYIQQFPHLRDVLCFSTDYPHYEGGKNPIGDMLGRVRQLNMPGLMEKFFVTNADLVMPS